MAIHSNYNKNLGAGMSPAQAYQLAYKQANNPPVRLNTKDKKAFKGEVQELVNGQLKDGWVSQKLLGGSADMRASTERAVTAKVEARALDLMAANVDQEVAVSQAMKEFNDTHTKLSNGDVVYGNKSALSRALGVPAGKVDEVLVSLPAALADSDAIISESPPEEWEMEISMDKKGGLVRFKDSLGAYVTRPIPLEEIGKTQREKMQAEWDKQAKDAYESQRETRERERRLQEARHLESQTRTKTGYPSGK